MISFLNFLQKCKVSGKAPKLSSMPASRADALVGRLALTAKCVSVQGAHSNTGLQALTQHHVLLMINRTLQLFQGYFFHQHWVCGA